MGTLVNDGFLARYVNGITDYVSLTLPALCISKSCIKIKINLMFIFTLVCDASKSSSKRFMKACKAFIKPFEAPQRSVKIKI